jgi:agmatinase
MTYGRAACVESLSFARITALLLPDHGQTRLSNPPSQSLHGEANTFSRLPCATEIHEEQIDLAILGIPFDGLVTARAGARLGPSAIRRASGGCRNYSRQMEVEVFEQLRAIDAGDVNVNPSNYEETCRGIEESVSKLQSRGAAVVSMGGDHSVSLPVLRATSRKYPQLTLIQFDAHTDTTDTAISGERYHHGTWIRRSIEEGLLEADRIFQIGIRGFVASASYDDYAKQAGINVLDMRGIHDHDQRSAFLKTLHATAGTGPCYLTFDIDGVDPAFAPGTGIPVAGGLTSFEAFDLMRSLRGLHFIGADVVEVAPAYDHSDITALLGAAIALEAAALIAIARRG